MSQTKKLSNKSLYRSLLAVALLLNGFFQFVSPVLAEGTKAGTSISNTATATYEDPNDPNTTLNSTTNEVIWEHLKWSLVPSSHAIHHLLVTSHQRWRDLSIPRISQNNLIMHD